MVIRELLWGSMDYAAAIAMRNELLCLPVGATVFERDLREEKDFFHIAAFDDTGNMIGTLMLRPESETQFHVNQVATLPALRGTGIGHALMTYAEDFARAKGVRILVLDARMYALHFYQSCGYTVYDEEFGRPELRLVPMRKMI
ncbi:MAG: GNAT family N-acetyltransferase [Clostridiaceae bacterium]|nr:GNAT family N-acetyltransferase [Clostridiaceae bacterium]